MNRFLLNPVVFVLVLLAGVSLPVFSSASFSFSSDKEYYLDSIKRHPAELLMPVDVELSEASVLYDSLSLGEMGMKEEVLEYALKGHQKMVEKRLVRNDSILTICDFSQSSRKKRLYIINLNNKEVLINTFVAHGRNSGAEFASSFSNTPESHKSSLGFYVTDMTYQGGHGLSLRVRGVERGFNDNAWNRAIVIHGSDYVGDHFIQMNQFMGRSFGCPAVSYKDHKQVINTIKGGSGLFIYHPSKNYLQKSKMINT